MPNFKPNLSLEVTDKEPRHRKDYGVIEDILGHDPDEAVQGFKNLKEKGIPLGKDTSLHYRKPVGGGFGMVLEKKF